MITHDIQRFSTHLAAIYSNLAKPTLDVILYNYQLSQNVGAEGLLVLTILVQSTAVLCEYWLGYTFHVLCGRFIKYAA
jgi:ATP-binding cassette, subfamily D (ALD), peroxisomal long-chain fatty acid import protein